jgi:hypothetical protein
MAIPAQFEDAAEFSEGRAAVKTAINGASSTRPARWSYRPNLLSDSILFSDTIVSPKEWLMFGSGKSGATLTWQANSFGGPRRPNFAATLVGSNSLWIYQ